MFYQVRILDRNGNVKKVISSDELRRGHWEKFDINKKNYLMPNKGGFESLEKVGYSVISFDRNFDR